MRLLITGGAGFIGSNYIRRIIDGSLKGITEVTVLDKLTYAGRRENLGKLPNDSFEFVQGDICDKSLVSKLTKRVDAIINFAAETHVDRSIEDSGSFINTNILGTHTLLDACLRNEVKNYVQISTDEVYGSILTGSWDEQYPVVPNSPYSASKASADLIALSFFKTFKLNVKITRCSNNYGPYQFPEKIIPLFTTRLIRGMKIPLYGDGLNRRDWLHVDDHCKAIHLVLTKGQAGEIYNIGGGRELSNLELTRCVLKELGADESSIDFVEDRPGHDFRYSINYEKISRELGYSPSVKFEVGLSETIRWYLDNTKWWMPLLKY